MGIYSKIKLAISFALRDISKSRFVLVFTIISLSAAFTAIFLSSGILQGFKNTLESGGIDTLGHLVIFPKDGDEKIENAENVIENLEKIANVESVSMRSQTSVSLEYADKKLGPYGMMGVDTTKESMVTRLPFDVVAGNFVSKDDPDGIVIGTTLADALVGLEYDEKKVPIGEKIAIVFPDGTKKFYTVAGILDAKTFAPNWMSYVNKREVDLVSPVIKNNVIVVKLKDPAILDQTRKILQKKYPNTIVRTWVEEASFVGDMVSATRLVTGSINSLLVSTVFVVMSVIIFINVFNHRRQIGILKSMGASNGFIMTIYIFEAFVYSIFSFAIGFSIFMLININSQENPIPLLIGDFHTELNVETILPSLFILVLATISGSLLPALKATRIRIADVLRDVI